MYDLKATWALILAAGESKRFGRIKALAPWQEGTLLSHAIHVSTTVTGQNTLVVLGAQAHHLQPYIHSIYSTVNPSWALGMGTSIATGVQAILMQDSHAEAILIVPVDHPLISPHDLIQLAQRCIETQKMVLTRNDITQGPPACLPHHFFPEALSLSGSKGLKSILTEANHTTFYNPRTLMDADTPDALNQLAGLANVGV